MAGVGVGIREKWDPLPPGGAPERCTLAMGGGVPWAPCRWSWRGTPPHLTGSRAKPSRQPSPPTVQGVAWKGSRAKPGEGEGTAPQALWVPGSHQAQSKRARGWPGPHSGLQGLAQFLAFWLGRKLSGEVRGPEGGWKPPLRTQAKGQNKVSRGRDEVMDGAVGPRGAPSQRLHTHIPHPLLLLWEMLRSGGLLRPIIRAPSGDAGEASGPQEGRGPRPRERLVSSRP